MVESARLKKLARHYMNENPGTKYQQALEAVQGSRADPAALTETPLDASLVTLASPVTLSETLYGTGDSDPAGPAAWLKALGGVPTNDELAERWATAASSPVLRAPIGVRVESDYSFGDDPEPLWFNLTDSHGLVVGRTGSGKSYALKLLLTGLATLNSPNQLQFVLIDAKGGTFTWIEQFPHTALSLQSWGRHPEDVLRFFDALEVEIVRRYDLINTYGAVDIIDYRRQGLPQTAEPIPDILLVVEELAALLQAYPQLRSRLHTLLQMGRGFGIHLLLSVQIPPPPEIFQHTTTLLNLGTSRRGDDDFLDNGPTGSGRLTTQSLSATGDTMRVFTTDLTVLKELDSLITAMPKSNYHIAGIKEAPTRSTN